MKSQSSTFLYQIIFTAFKRLKRKKKKNTLIPIITKCWILNSIMDWLRDIHVHNLMLLVLLRLNDISCQKTTFNTGHLNAVWVFLLSCSFCFYVCSLGYFYLFTWTNFSLSEFSLWGSVEDILSHMSDVVVVPTGLVWLCSESVFPPHSNHTDADDMQTSGSST